MSISPLTNRPTATAARCIGMALAVLAPVGIAAAAEPSTAPLFYSAATVFLVAVICVVLAIVAGWFALARKNREMRTLQDEIDHLRNDLEAIAISDPLTGLYNRRYMDAQLKMALSYARRQQNPLSIAIADIDLFRAINDEYGHQRADQILKDVATAIQGVLRDEDIACRYGGEEFILILPSTGLAGGIICAERLRAEVQSKALHGIIVTVSVGVASTEAHADLSVEDLTERAEKALYAAKVRGRNLVVSEADDIGAIEIPHRHGERPPYLH